MMIGAGDPALQIADPGGQWRRGCRPPRERGRPLRQARHRRRQLGADRRKCLCRSGPLRLCIINLPLQFGGFGLKPRDGVAGITAKAFLTPDIVAHLCLLCGHPGDGITDPGFLAIKLVTADGQALEFGGPRHFGLAKFRQRGGFSARTAGTGGGRLGAFSGDRPGRAKGIIGIGEGGLSRAPPRHQKLGFGFADTVGDRPVARCLAGLFAKRIPLFDKAGDHIVKPFKIGLGTAEPKFGLMPAGVKAANIAASSRRARRSTGFAPTIAPIRPVRQCPRTAPRSPNPRTEAARPWPAPAWRSHKSCFLAALDLAGDLDFIIIIEIARRRAGAVVEMQGDFGKVARRPLVSAGKDDVIHLGTAHLARVAFAHDPEDLRRCWISRSHSGPTMPVRPSSISTPRFPRRI